LTLTSFQEWYFFRLLKDPFVDIEFAGQKYTSKVKEGAGKVATWDEFATFNVLKPITNETLRFIFKDQDNSTFDFIGEAAVAVGDLAKKVKFEEIRQ
jgi:hypothetical protein